MITLRIDMAGTPRLPRMGAAEMNFIARVAAQGVAGEVAKNFTRLAAASGSRSYWREAAGSTRVEETAGAEGALRGTAAVVVRKVGVRLHWLGGDVRATGQRSEVTGKPTRALLIPFEDSPLHKQRKTLHELGYPQEQVHVVKSRNGCPLLVAEDRKKTRTNLIWLGKLVERAHFEPRPEVMPSDEAMHAAAVQHAKDFLSTLSKK